ncbi:MAG: hypothetical protein HY892_20625 [Deltaproteobacteria bacterium]|nr:hypothetical protein [Deltaproteobacteria bacterium]
MVVASRIAGRLRIRSEALKQEPRLLAVREALLATPGVGGVEANPRVGSLLVLYSEAATKAEEILKVVSNSLESGPGPGSAGERRRKSVEGPPTCRATLTMKLARKRKIRKVGLLTSLALNLLGAIFDLKKLHLPAGLIFVALVGDHVYQRRARVFS